MLLAVDEFFRQLGLAEIRVRSSRDDKPLRMVKTLLHELCKKKVRVCMYAMRRSSCERSLRSRLAMPSGAPVRQLQELGGTFGCTSIAAANFPHKTTGARSHDWSGRLSRATDLSMH